MSNKEITNEAFIKRFKEKVIGYSHMFKFPLKGETLEEVIHNSLLETGILSEWDCASHKQGADISIKNSNFSVKSGQFRGIANPELSISSHRTTTYKTIAEKISFFDGKGKNYGAYLVLARTEDKKAEKRIYQALLIEAEFVKASSFTWETTKSGWQTTDYDKLDIRIKIQKKMSDQFWIYARKRALQKSNKVTELFSVEFNYKELGKGNHLLNKEVISAT